MRNMLEVLMNAKNRKTDYLQDEFISTLEKIKDTDTELTIDWDDGAGEEWGRIIHSKLGRIAILNRRIAVIFIRMDYDYRCFSEFLDNFELVMTEDFSKDEWYIDLDELGKKVDEIDWHSSKEAVNPEQFCLSDFYVATV